MSLEAAIAHSPEGKPAIAGSFTPDGRRFLNGNIDEDLNSHLDVLDATTLEPVGGAPLALGPAARFLAVTPDGRQAVVVLSSFSKSDPEPTTVPLVDLDERRIVRSTPIDSTGRGAARHNAVASDGHTVGLGFTLGQVQIADAVTGELSPPFQAHDGFVDNISFAPDIATFVTSGTDGAIKLWDTKTQQLLGAVEPLGANQPVVAWFTSPSRVLIAYASGELLEWDTRADAWEAHACTVAGRNFTTAEWAELLPDRPYRSTCPSTRPASRGVLQLGLREGLRLGARSSPVRESRGRPGCHVRHPGEHVTERGAHGLNPMVTDHQDIQPARWSKIARRALRPGCRAVACRAWVGSCEPAGVPADSRSTGTLLVRQGSECTAVAIRIGLRDSPTRSPEPPGTGQAPTRSSPFGAS